MSNYNISSQFMGKRDEKVSSFLKQRIVAGDFPSAVYLVAERGSIILADALGDAVRMPEHIKATINTIYDLASLTKPLITGLLCARLVERGEMEIDSAVSQALREFNRPDKSRITVRQLLTHTSGLPAWRPLYITTGGERKNVLTAITEEPLEYVPGTAVRYSDLGFITLGLLLEEIHGAPLAELAQREIFVPLKLRCTFFNPDIKLRAQIAASESGNGFEREKSRDMLESSTFNKWREDVIWGEVHDGNAYFMGGVAGHAGLFSNAHETFRLAEQFIPGRTAMLAAKTCELFRTNMTPRLEEARSFAWQLAETENSTAGPTLSPNSFGHLGFTGTSCWIDAARERVYILLTNRTHARKLPFVIINDVRRTFHALASAALDGSS